MNFTKIANKIIAELQKEGVTAYLWHKATTGSVYVRFEDPRIGSIRIGNHNGRDQYQYKFNVRSDMKGNGRWIKPEKTWRYFQPLETWKDIIPVIVKRAQDVAQQGTPVRYQYGIPSWKRNSDNHAAKD